MRQKKVSLYNLLLALLLIVPALFFDLLLFATTSSCTSCANFWEFIRHPSSLSYPYLLFLAENSKSLLESIKRLV